MCAKSRMGLTVTQPGVVSHSDRGNLGLRGNYMEGRQCSFVCFQRVHKKDALFMTVFNRENSHLYDYNIHVCTVVYRTIMYLGFE